MPPVICNKEIDNNIITYWDGHKLNDKNIFLNSMRQMFKCTLVNNVSNILIS